jgi:hypothetical protein
MLPDFFGLEGGGSPGRVPGRSNSVPCLYGENLVPEMACTPVAREERQISAISVKRKPLCMRLNTIGM